MTLDGCGHAVDHVAEMARFDEDAQLDRLAAAGRLDPALMPKLADAIERLHEIAGRSFDHRGFDGMWATLRGVCKALRKNSLDVLDPDAVDRLSAAGREALRRWAVLLDDPRDRGLVRHGHGDLHLRYICLRNGQPVLFDCIEFNPALRCVDVLYDLAFLLMELLHRGLTSHANGVLNRYVESMHDIDGLTLLPLFLATRAAVRAMTSPVAVAAQSRAEVADALPVEARQYLELAQTLIAPRPPLLVAVGGPSGVGKTTLARCLAASIGPASGSTLLLRSGRPGSTPGPATSPTPLLPFQYGDAMDPSPRFVDRARCERPCHHRVSGGAARSRRLQPARHRTGGAGAGTLTRTSRHVQSAFRFIAVPRLSAPARNQRLLTARVNYR